MRAGDRVRLYGGYDAPVPWLGGKEERTGTCIGFLSEEDKRTTAVVELDEPVACKGTTGKHVLLRLRYVGARWAKREIVHVELCDFLPDERTHKEKKRGVWVESHSNYAVVA